jgi:hypothetical protein
MISGNPYAMDKNAQVGGIPSDRTSQALVVASSTTQVEEPNDDCVYDLDKFLGCSSVATGAIGMTYVPSSALIRYVRPLRDKREWILDTGASFVICVDRSMFVTFHPNTGNETWDTSGGQTVTSKGSGVVCIPLRKPDGSQFNLYVEAIYQPDIQFNLLGLIDVNMLCGVTWDINDLLLRDALENAIGYTFVAKKVLFMELAAAPNPMQYASPSAYGLRTQGVKSLIGCQVTDVVMGVISAELAHRRLGHAGYHKTRVNKELLGVDVVDEGAFDCEACGLGKSKRVVSRVHQARATRPGQLVHVDLHPMKPQGFNSETGRFDCEHLMSIIDD